MTDNPQTDRRDRYAAAMDAVTGGICPADLIDAVMAVVDGEQAELQRSLAQAQAEAHQYRTALQGVARREPAAALAADRTAVLREAAAIAGRLPIDDRYRHHSRLGDAWDAGRDAVVQLLRRKADGVQQPDTETPTESVLYQVVGDWGVESADDAEEARAAVASWLSDHPHSGAHAEQRIYREWPDGSEYYGPWTDLPPTAEAPQ